MVKKHYEFFPGDRYRYDFGMCSTKNGLAQVDNWQDASYFGIWANPFKRIIFSYAEGDCTTKACDDDNEFVAEMREMKEFYGSGFKGIDPGFNEELKQQFIELGLGDLLH